MRGLNEISRGEGKLFLYIETIKYLFYNAQISDKARTFTKTLDNPCDFPVGWVSLV